MRPSSDSDSAPLGEGSRVGGYVLGRRLGAGGMATVFHARHTETGGEYALKVLAGGDPEGVLRFQREAQAQAAVDAHPNILRVHGAGVHGRYVYLVMELARGGSLADRLRQGPLPAHEGARLGIALADALAHAHAQGVLHRDLKPDNVLFDELGVPRLCDFGLARIAGEERLTQTGSVMGTPAYLAPEQARGDPVDERTDVYGLGALLYHALTGRPPHVAGSTMAILLAVQEEPPPPPRSLVPELSPALEQVCLKSLSKSSTDRFASARALGAALEATLTSQGVSSGRRLPVLCLLLACVGLALWALRSASTAPDPSSPQPEQPAQQLPEQPAAPDPKAARLALGQLELLVDDARDLEAACDGWLSTHYGSPGTERARELWVRARLSAPARVLTLGDPTPAGARYSGLLCFGAPPRVVVGGGGSVGCWDISGAEPRSLWARDREARILQLAACAGRPDLLLTGTGLAGLDLATGRLLWLVSEGGSLPVAAWRPDGTSITAGRLGQGLVEVYSVGPGRAPKRERRSPLHAGHGTGIESLAYTHDGEWLLIGCKIPCDLDLASRAAGELHLLRGSQLLVHRLSARPTALATHPSRPLFAVGTHFGTLELVDLSQAGEGPGGAPVSKPFIQGPGAIEFRGHTSAVRAAAFTPDGSQLLSCGRTSDESTGGWRLWSVEDQRLIRESPPDRHHTRTLALSPDGGWFAASIDARGDEPARVEVWRIDPYALGGHGDWARSE
jgi:Protein kinase domain/WD domain, G-beta repeat